MADHDTSWHAAPTPDDTPPLLAVTASSSHISTGTVVAARHALCSQLAHIQATLDTVEASLRTARQDAQTAWASYLDRLYTQHHRLETQLAQLRTQRAQLEHDIVNTRIANAAEVLVLKAQTRDALKELEIGKRGVIAQLQAEEDAARQAATKAKQELTRCMQAVME